ncbi:MAG: TldD/PmbA family protein [Clostridia bacterium]|nr:TldD/PmbA family protein [Clostridia bacterium]
MKDFLNRLLSTAAENGIEASEAYYVEKESFSLMRCQGDGEYKSNQTRGLGFRGLMNGRMGYASTEAFDDEAIQQLVKGVKESAELCENDDVQILYKGGDQLPEIQLYQPQLDQVSAETKLEAAAKLEEMSSGMDERIVNGYYGVETGKVTVRIMNSYGMDRSYTENVCAIFSQPNAKDGECVSSGGYQQLERDFSKLDVEKVAKEAVKRAVDGLHAQPVPSGVYRIVLDPEAMTSLLGVFATVFSGETEQKGLSLLSGKMGQTVAADCVTLVDDPLMPQCFDSRPFDAEGVPSRRNVLLEKGVFQGFLHNLKTAKKAGVESTGNASKAGFAGAVRVSPSNLYFEKGSISLEQLLKNVGDGIVINDVSGLHAGANPVSGDFSLLAKGYTLKDGKRDKPVERITVAGNFYELLKNIRCFADDLTFPGGSIGSATVDVGEMTVSGS